jgi:hypothetical protein
MKELLQIILRAQFQMDQYYLRTVTRGRKYELTIYDLKAFNASNIVQRLGKVALVEKSKSDPITFTLISKI